MKDLATSMLESVKSFRNGTKPNTKVEEMGDDDMPDDNTPPNDNDEPTKTDEPSAGGLDGLEKSLSTALSDLGISTCKASQDDDGSVYVDMSFDDGTNASLEISVSNEGDESGMPMAYLVTDDSGEAVDELQLPDSIVMDGKICLDNLADLPMDDIKTMISKVVKVSDEVEGFRRSGGIGESVSVKKKFVSEIFKNESKWLRARIKARKVESRK